MNGPTDMVALRRDLAFHLTLNPLATGELTHIMPACESGTSGDEAGKRIAVNAVNILAIFDAACVKHCLERLKVRCARA
jgi:hypothetical protein